MSVDDGGETGKIPQKCMPCDQWISIEGWLSHLISDDHQDKVSDRSGNIYGHESWEDEAACCLKVTGVKEINFKILVQYLSRWGELVDIVKVQQGVEGGYYVKFDGIDAVSKILSTQKRVPHQLQGRLIYFTRKYETDGGGSESNTPTGIGLLTEYLDVNETALGALKETYEDVDDGAINIEKSTKEAQRTEIVETKEIATTQEEHDLFSTKMIEHLSKVLSDKNLDDQLDGFCKNILLSEAYLAGRLRVVQELLEIIKKRYPKTTLHPCGMDYIGIGNSDDPVKVYVDLFDNVLEVEKQAWEINPVQQVPQVVKALKVEADNGRFCSNVVEDGERVTFIHLASQVKVSMRFSGYQMVHEALLIKFLCTLDPRVSLLLSLIRYWSSVNKVFFDVPGSEDSKGRLLVLLMTFHLINRKVVPSLEKLQKEAHEPVVLDGIDVSFCTDKSTLSLPNTSALEDKSILTLSAMSLLKDFFQRFGIANFKDNAVSLWYGKFIEKKNFKNQNLLPEEFSRRLKSFDNGTGLKLDINTGNQDYYLCIQDFFNLNLNIGLDLHSDEIKKLQSAAWKTGEKLEVVINSSKPSLMNIFTHCDIDVQIEKRKESERQKEFHEMHQTVQQEQKRLLQIKRQKEEQDRQLRVNKEEEDKRIKAQNEEETRRIRLREEEQERRQRLKREEEEKNRRLQRDREIERQRILIQEEDERRKFSRREKEQFRFQKQAQKRPHTEVEKVSRSRPSGYGYNQKQKRFDNYHNGGQTKNIQPLMTVPFGDNVSRSQQIYASVGFGSSLYGEHVKQSGTLRNDQFHEHPNSASYSKSSTFRDPTYSQFETNQRQNPEVIRRDGLGGNSSRSRVRNEVSNSTVSFEDHAAHYTDICKPVIPPLIQSAISSRSTTTSIYDVDSSSRNIPKQIVTFESTPTYGENMRRHVDPYSIERTFANIQADVSTTGHDSDNRNRSNQRQQDIELKRYNPITSFQATEVSTNTSNLRDDQDDEWLNTEWEEFSKSLEQPSINPPSSFLTFTRSKSRKPVAPISPYLNPPPPPPGPPPPRTLQFDRDIARKTTVRSQSSSESSSHDEEELEDNRVGSPALSMDNSKIRNPYPLPRININPYIKNLFIEAVASNDFEYGIRGKFQTLLQQFMKEFNNRFWQKCFKFEVELDPTYQDTSSADFAKFAERNTMKISQLLSTVPIFEDNFVTSFYCQSAGHMSVLLVDAKPSNFRSRKFINKKAKSLLKVLMEEKPGRFVQTNQNLRFKANVGIMLDYKNLNQDCNPYIKIVFDKGFATQNEMLALFRFFGRLYEQMAMKFLTYCFKRWLASCSDVDLKASEKRCGQLEEEHGNTISGNTTVRFNAIQPNQDFRRHSEFQETSLHLLNTDRIPQNILQNNPAPLMYQERMQNSAYQADPAAVANKGSKFIPRRGKTFQVPNGWNRSMNLASSSANTFIVRR